MKKTLLTVSESIGRYSLLLVQISATALVGSLAISGAILIGRAIQPLEKPTQRVAVAATNIGAIGLSGLIASGALYVCIGGKNDEEEPRTLTLTISRNKRDERWEQLVPELWGTEYNVSACRGCKHLVGRVAPNQFLVCGMHPYGKDDCPDWEEN